MKRKPGRPKGSKNKKKIVWLRAPKDKHQRINWTEEEWHDLENVASARGMKSCDYVRSRVLNAVARDMSKGFDFYAIS